MSCGVGHKHSLDLMELWLWHRPAGTAPIGPLAWKLSYATGAAPPPKKKEAKNITVNKTDEIPYPTELVL